MNCSKVLGHILNIFSIAVKGVALMFQHPNTQIADSTSHILHFASTAFNYIDNHF